MQNARYLQGLTLNHTNAGFSLGTTSTYTTAATTVCSFGGKFGTTLGAGSNVASPTTDAATGLAFNPIQAGSADTRNGRATVVVAGVNAAGAIRYCQGSVVKTALGVTTTAGAFIDAPQFPTLPDDFVPLAYFLIRNSPSAAAFTVGTTSWTASGITCSTPQNISTLPDRPQTA